VSLVTSVSGLKKGKWYYSPNLWAVERPNAVEMNKENTQFIQTIIDKKILFTTADEAVQQAVKILKFIGGEFKAPRAVVVQGSYQVVNSDNLDLFEVVA
jgi:DNA polymerase sigma